MNAKTLFKRSGRTDTLSFTVNAFYQIKMTLVELHITLLAINSTNKCTAEDHVVSPDVIHVTSSNTTVFFPPGEGVNNSLKTFICPIDNIKCFRRK